MMRLLAGLFLLFLPVAAWSAQVRVLENTTHTLSVEVTADYVLGDGDSRLDGRNLALDAAKRAAAEAAGSYVESEVVFADNRVERERITTFSAAFLKTRILDESLALTPEGRMKLTLKMQASLDKVDLRRRVAELREQPQKEKQIQDLQKRNEDLRRELATLNAQLQAARTAPPATKAAPAATPKPRAELVERRDVILTRIEQNEAAIRHVFERGTLAGLARQADTAYEQAKEEIDTHVLGYLVNNLKITMGEPSFVKSGPDRYEITVPVSWTIDSRPMWETLNRYFWAWGKKPLPSDNPLRIFPDLNRGEKRKEAFSAKLMDHLLANRVAIVVRAGRHSGRLTISGNHSNVFDIRWQGKMGAKLLSSETNPVVIKDIPASELENITALEARAELVRR